MDTAKDIWISILQISKEKYKNVLTQSSAMLMWLLHIDFQQGLPSLETTLSGTAQLYQSELYSFVSLFM
jgi:hypothetical protein